MSVVGSGFAVGSAALGVGLLRTAWSRRGGGRHWVTAAGWMAFVCGAGAWHAAGLGWDEGIALAMLAPSLMAFLVLARQAEWRPTAAGAGSGRWQKGVTRRAIGTAVAAQWTAGMPTPKRAMAAERKLVGAPRTASAQAAARSQRAMRVGARARSGSVPGGALGRGVVRTLLAGPGALAAALGLTGLVALRAPGLEADRLATAGFVLPVAWAVGAVWATLDRKLTRVAVGLCVTAVVCVGGAVV